MNYRPTHKLAMTLAAGALMLSVRLGAFGQTPAPAPLDLTGKLEKPSLFAGQSLSYVDKNGAATRASKPFLESLRGNGTRAGYMLSHGGIVPASVRVSVGARSLRANTDFSLDYNSGMLVFAEPVRRFDTVTVSYEYVEGLDGSRSVAPNSGLAMNFRGTSLNFGYGVSSFNGLDFNSYGLAMNSKVGSSGSLTGLMYFSTPAASNGNVVGRTDTTRAGNQKRNEAAAKSDRLITQNLNIKSGNATVRATFQDVGAAFGGFQAMRQSNANNASLLQEIANLEKERGIKRLGFGSSLNLGGQSAVGVDWDRITDSTGDVTRQGMSLNLKGMSFQYSDLNIDKGFSAFKQLREGEAGQWARERGIRRTTMSFGLTPGKDSTLGFGQTSLRDATGAMTRQNITLNTKTTQVAYSRRSAEGSFGRLNDLSDAEKTELALDIRRQFNPNAAAGEVTQQDRQQIGLDAGLDRSRLAMKTALDKNTGLAFSQFTIGDGSGSIRRNTLALSGKSFTLNYLDQNVDRDFARLGNLSDFERSQFGNERGMRRSALDMTLKLNGASSLAFNQASFGDDSGRLTRQSIAYTGKGLNARLNLASSDQAFARARDIAGLSDNDRKVIEEERGFKRMDFAADVTALKGLSLQTYVYNANNATTDETRNRYRHFAIFTPSLTSRIALLNEGGSSAFGGAVANGVDHTNIALDQQLARGMKLNAFTDTVRTVAGDQRSSVTTNFLHFETDRSKANNLMAETKRIQHSDSRFENTTQLDMNFRPARNMSLRLNHLNVDRGSEPSAMTNVVELGVQLSKTLSFSTAYSLTDTNNGTNASAKSFSLAGALTSNLNFKGTYTEAGVVGRNRRAASDIAISNAKPFSFLGLRDTTMSFKYVALNDQGRKNSEAVAGTMQAKLGNNQLAFEYGGSLDPKNNSAVSRSFSFISDRNEKLPLHFDILYKARNINGGDVQLVRRYNLALRVDKQTSMTYTYSSLPEDGAGKMQPLVSSAFALNRSLGADTKFALNYTTNVDMAKRTSVRKLGAMLQTKIAKLTAVQVGYSVDMSNLNGRDTNAHTLSLSLDRRINADNVLAFGAAYTKNMNGAADDVQGTVEFKTRF